jgi:hypothetical protein
MVAAYMSHVYGIDGPRSMAADGNAGRLNGRQTRSPMTTKTGWEGGGELKCPSRQPLGQFAEYPISSIPNWVYVALLRKQLLMAHHFSVPVAHHFSLPMAHHGCSTNSMPLVIVTIGSIAIWCATDTKPGESEVFFHFLKHPLVAHLFPTPLETIILFFFH